MSFKRFLLVFFMMTLSAQTFAYERDNSRVDKYCDDKILWIRNNIARWLVGTGPKRLQLPTDITPDMYVGVMLHAMEVTKVSCTNKVLKVGGAEKTCVSTNRRDNKTSIVCNAQRFNKLVQAPGPFIDAYFMIHHEYAALTSLEGSYGNATSNYTISRQFKKLYFELKEVTPNPSNLKFQTVFVDRSGIKWGQKLPGTYHNGCVLLAGKTHCSERDFADANSPAEDACKAIGAELPSENDYLSLFIQFGGRLQISRDIDYYTRNFGERRVEMDVKDRDLLRKTLGDMNTTYWTKSSAQGPSGSKNYGVVISNAYLESRPLEYAYAVRCVIK